MAYTAIVLTRESQEKLLGAFADLLRGRNDWSALAHHVTLHMGSPTAEEAAMIGSTVALTADAVGGNDLVLAVRVVPWFGHKDIKSKNPIPHITLAVNKLAGGKPVMSNHLKNWELLSEPIFLKGNLEKISD
jgi:hypothetical protein